MEKAVSSISASGDEQPPRRTRDPERTQAEILDVATEEFAERGYSGARVDEIAARTRTTKRMIYYYFGSKEDLFRAVLERSYAELRARDSALDLTGVDPLTALRRIVRSTYDYHVEHPDFVRLVMVENIHQAKHLAGLASVGKLGVPAVDALAATIRAGREAGVFRRAAEPLDVHMVISSFSIYQVANRHSFKALFGRDLLDPAMVEQHRRLLEELVVDYLTCDEVTPE